MIKIQEHLNRADAEDFLDSLAEEQWQSLNPRLANGKGYIQNSLIEKCRKYKNKIGESEYLKKYASNRKRTARRHESFFNFLLDQDAKELKRLVISRPPEFLAIKTNIFSILQPDDLYTGTPGNYSQTPFGLLLSDTIFNYTAFRKSDFCKELFSTLGFKSATCPYCNDNKLNIVELQSNSTQKTKLRAYFDLDHFYPKSISPFFAVSFFNLIPSCHDCNAMDKQNIPFTIETHIHPYHEAFDDNYKFVISLVGIIGGPLDRIEIENRQTKPQDITLRDIKLVERYANNIGGARKLITSFLNNKHHIGTIYEDSFREVLLQDVPVERKDILNHQRAKMNRDILKQVDIDNSLNIQ